MLRAEEVFRERNLVRLVVDLGALGLLKRGGHCRDDMAAVGVLRGNDSLSLDSEPCVFQTGQDALPKSCVFLRGEEQVREADDRKAVCHRGTVLGRFQ